VSCGQNQIVFKGPETLADFCQWLFDVRNDSYVAIAHNARGYDSQFLLAYLHTQSLKPTVLTRGLKLLSLMVGGIKVIDSLSFLPMALAAMPKAFSLKELCKGTFPHMFNRKENWDYVGKLPALDFYDPDHLKAKAREELLKWHGEHEDDHFNFQKELESYCKLMGFFTFRNGRMTSKFFYLF
jgi:hypothetical protein